jgi:hypothetical protein
MVATKVKINLLLLLACVIVEHVKSQFNILLLHTTTT